MRLPTEFWTNWVMLTKRISSIKSDLIQSVCQIKPTAAAQKKKHNLTIMFSDQSRSNLLFKNVELGKHLDSVHLSKAFFGHARGKKIKRVPLCHRLVSVDFYLTAGHTDKASRLWQMRS